MKRIKEGGEAWEEVGEGDKDHIQKGGINDKRPRRVTSNPKQDEEERNSDKPTRTPSFRGAFSGLLAVGSAKREQGRPFWKEDQGLTRHCHSSACLLAINVLAIALA